MIAGDLVTLRARRADDVPHAKRWYADEETTRWLLDDDEAFEVPDRPIEFGDVLLTVVDTASGAPIGTAGLVDASPEHRHARAFVVIGEAAFRGRGYGTDTTRTLCRFAFGWMNLAKVEAEVVAGHATALAASERVGFVREVHRRAAVWLHGAWHDEHLLGLLAEELR